MTEMGKAAKRRISSGPRSDWFRARRKIESKGAAPNIPPKSNRRWKNCFSPWLYRHRNAVERMFRRLKDFRRIATRYDRLARNFLDGLPRRYPLLLVMSLGPRKISPPSSSAQK